VRVCGQNRGPAAPAFSIAAAGPSSIVTKLRNPTATACPARSGFGSLYVSSRPRIKSRAAYEKGLTALPDWRIACNFVGKGHRRQGVATAALAGALELIADLGGGRVEGYPEDAGSVPAGFLFNGALSTYEKLGFVRDRKIGKHRWVVAKVVEPNS
jgi:GNAT superfamily N-acetyltransferase